MVQADMIDTWLFTALVLGVLSLCVILRGIRTASQDDRLVAGTVAVIFVSMAALALCIALSMLIILDVIIVFSIIGFGVLIWTGKQPGADRS
jgi:threonine/homoserine/homoserine lactone efflux protein